MSNADARQTPATLIPATARSAKLKPEHLDRLAIVYVRQSSPLQVLEHAESRARQYDLARHAAALGWAPDRVEVIDEDQGKSGRSAEHRLGFRRMLSEVTLGHVGVILGLEMSRLARSSKDWHHLLELCALFGTLLGDPDGVYDPADSNDRLLLGLKGTMSEFELTTMRNRLRGGIENKAARGEMHIAPPVGYQKLQTGEVVPDTDERAREVIRLIFDKFDELGTARRVFVYLIRNGVELGVRLNRGSRRGELEWRRPVIATVIRILQHPVYAGAYVFGRRQSGKDCWRPGSWRILLRDRMPAYITWERYEANQARLIANHTGRGGAGSTRDGQALLTGLATCGRCGRRLRTQHPKQGRPRYLCVRHLERQTDDDCGSLAARAVDDLVAGKVMEALSPAGLELSLRAVADAQAERDRLTGLWRKKITQARFEAERAERQYQAVEPENRLVARTLEQRWEAALTKLREAEEDYNRFAQDRPTSLSDVERGRIEALASDIPALWRAPATGNVDRKDIVRCLVEKVEVLLQGRTEYCDVTIHWKGGYTSQHEITRPIRQLDQLRDLGRLREVITGWHGQGLKAKEIAEALTEEGFFPARKGGGRYTASHVQWLLRRFGLSEQRRRGGLLPGEWWLPDLARKLGMPRKKLREWAVRGWCHSRQPEGQSSWVVWADEEESDRLRRLAGESHKGKSGYPAELTTPKQRPD